MKQAGDDPELKQSYAERRGIAPRTLIAVHQAYHCQRHIHHMLHIMVSGIAGEVARKITAVKAANIGEGLIHRTVCGTRIEQAEQTRNLALHRGRIGRLNPIGDIKIVAPNLHHLAFASKNDVFIVMAAVFRPAAHSPLLSARRYTGGTLPLFDTAIRKKSIYFLTLRYVQNLPARAIFLVWNVTHDEQRKLRCHSAPAH